METLRRVSRLRKVVVGLANEMVRGTALSAAATSTRNELKQHGRLKKVSICATIQDDDNDLPGPPESPNNSSKPATLRAARAS